MDADLYAAVAAGDFDSVLKLREKSNQVTEGNNDSILHLAVLSGEFPCFYFILKEFPKLLDQVNSRNETALHVAATKGNPDMVEMLISAAACLNLDGYIRKVNVDLDTALHLAVRNYDPHMIYIGKWPEIYHGAVVEMIVEADPSDEHSQNLNSETPLYLAAIAGKSFIVDLIFKYCSNPSVEGPQGRTALHAALIGRNPDCVSLIMSKKGDLLEMVDNKGWTVFHYAASLNSVRELSLLLLFAETTDITRVTTGEKKTAHHIAASQGHIYILTLLIERCPEAFGAVDADGRNILHLAAEKGHKELIQYILQDFPDNIDKLLNREDKNGNTPLHLLVIAGCFVPQLINHKDVNTNIRNKDRFTCQDLLYMDEDIVGDQLMIKKAFWELTVNRRSIRNLWLQKPEQAEPRTSESVVVPSERRRKDAKFKMAKTNLMKEEVRLYRERSNTQIIVTALIATVTFTVGFTMPGGNHDGDTGDAENGLSILSKKTAFNVCIVADAIGLLFSASSLFLYFMSSLYQDPHEVSKYIAASTGFNIVSVVAMMLTFITGTYAVLSHSPAIALTVSVISCVFFLLVVVLLIKWKYDPIEKFKV